MFRGIDIARNVVIRVTAYERGPRNRKFLVYELIQTQDPRDVGRQGHLRPEQMQQRFVPYVSNGPPTAEQSKPLVIPLRPRTDTH